jgi:long-chain acyl-CoA synthetase
MPDRGEYAAKGMTLAWWAQEIPDHKAIISPTGDRTFAELNANANRLARALRARGLGEGDAVALMCTNRPAFVETWAACLRAGFRITTINWHLTGDEAGYIVDDCEAKALVADSALAEGAKGAAATAPNCKVLLAVGGDIDGFESYEAALAAEDGSDIEDPTPGSQMLYTSGTTGRPKGVYRPPAQATAAAASSSVNLWGYQEGSSDLHLCTGPLYHAAPLAFSLAAPLAFGVGVVLMEKWDAEEALRLIAEHKITHTHLVPTMFHRLLALPDDVRAKYDLSSLRLILHGAAPWMTMRSDDRSYLPRTSSATASSRWNMIGTRWVWVMRWSSTSRSMGSGSHPSMRTVPTPACSGAPREKASGAAWYRGPVQRCRSPSGRYP